MSNFKDYRFLQVFYPTRGILAWYNRATGKLQPLPGADDPRYVHTDAVWSPDGKYLVFARAEARDPYPAGAQAGRVRQRSERDRRSSTTSTASPSTTGRAARPEPIAGASRNGMSNSFPKVSPDGRWIVYVQARNGQLMRPDSQLYIVPAAGGEARRMRCNTPLMNSWHSFSPNGRWLVFSSKSRSPYTQMFLTHLDEDGNDSPAILIENATAANRAVNIPEFVNIPPGGLLKIDAPATEFYRVVDSASDLLKKNQYAAAAVRVAEGARARSGRSPDAQQSGLLAGGDRQAGRRHRALSEGAGTEPRLSGSTQQSRQRPVRGHHLPEAVEQFEKALESNPNQASAHVNLGAALAQLGRLDEAMPHLEKAVELLPEDAEAHTNLGTRPRHEGSTGRCHSALGEGGGGQSGERSKISSIWGGFWRRRGNSSRPFRISNSPQDCRADGKPSS